MAKILAWIIDKAKHSILRTISVVCVLAVIWFVGYACWNVIKPKPTNNTNINNPANVNMDCSLQVSKAIVDTENRLKKSDPKITIRLWKIATLNLFGG